MVGCQLKYVGIRGYLACEELNMDYFMDMATTTAGWQLRDRLILEVAPPRLLDWDGPMCEMQFNDVVGYFINRVQDYTRGRCSTSVTSCPTPSKEANRIIIEFLLWHKVGLLTYRERVGQIGVAERAMDQALECLGWGCGDG